MKRREFLQRAAAGAKVRDHVLFQQDFERLGTAGKSAEDMAISENPSHIRAIRDGEWKYAYYFSPGREEVEHELYHPNEEPLELHNLADDAGCRSVREELFAWLMEEERRLEAEIQQR